MNSPFTDGATVLQTEYRVFIYRNKPVAIYYQYCVCLQTNGRFTTTAIDTRNINRVYRAYNKLWKDEEN